MKWAARVISAYVANGIGLVLSAKLLHGFVLEDGVSSLAAIALILTGLNFLVKPVLKLVLGPVIVFTLGLGLVAVNAVVLYILDALSNQISIEGALTFVLASVIIGLVNFLFHLFTK